MFSSLKSSGTLLGTLPLKVPLVGDLLGRKRVTGAKKTRLGCDSPSERFQNIVEAPALWHTKQSFLGVSELRI